MSQNYSNIVKRLQDLEADLIKITANSTGNELGILFTIKDTEFLLSILENISIPVNRIEAANKTIEKIKGLHAILMEKGVTV